MSTQTTYVVCPECRGRGVTTLHGASFSADEWNRAIYEDEDWEENYKSGTLDTDCEMCNGRTTVTAQFLEDWNAGWEGRAIQEAERRVGA